MLIGRSGEKPVTADIFRKALAVEFEKATRAGRDSVRITAGALHSTLGGYPGQDHRMPVCCGVMRNATIAGDTVIASPPSGQGATLTIEYLLPRLGPFRAWLRLLWRRVRRLKRR